MLDQTSTGLSGVETLEKFVSSSPTRTISANDRIPFLQKIMFSAGGTMDYVATGLSTSVVWMPYFNIGLGIDPALLGIVLMILRGWDAFVDPVMGNLSDNTRTRWGRRRPFMVVGAILTAALFPFLWRVPAGLGATGQIVYLVIIGIVFFTCFSCWSMPYFGLQLELTPDYDERTRLTAWMTLCGKFTSLAGGWILAILTSHWFANPETGKPDIVHALKICSWFIAGFILVAGLLPPLFVKERYYETETKYQSREPFWQSIRESMRCGPLWLLIGISFFLVLGSTLSGVLGQYMNIYFVNQGKLAHASIISGWSQTAMFAMGILTIPFWTWMGERFDKKILVTVLLTGSMLGHLLNFVCLRADEPYLQLIPAVFSSMVVSAVWLFLPSMKADVADYDELTTTRRREGALNAFYSWFIKAAITLAAGAGGITLHLTGFDSAILAQPPEVLERMKLLYLAMPFALWSITLIFIRYYPLNRQRMAAIRSELEIRRGKV
jgi:GPH family glycoside/pentoside/hexuronide:cation symporter